MWGLNLSRELSWSVVIEYRAYSPAANLSSRLKLKMVVNWIGHFRVCSGLCFKTRVRAQPLIWKSFFIFMKIKLIFTRKVVHLASFWTWGILEPGSGLFIDSADKKKCLCSIRNCQIFAVMFLSKIKEERWKWIGKLETSTVNLPVLVFP